MSTHVDPTTLPYGTKVFVNGEFKGFVFFPRGDYIEQILAETVDGVLTKLGFKGKNDEIIMLTITAGKVSHIDFTKADGRVFSRDIPE